MVFWWYPGVKLIYFKGRKTLQKRFLMLLQVIEEN